MMYNKALEQLQAWTTTEQFPSEKSEVILYMLLTYTST